MNFCELTKQERAIVENAAVKLAAKGLKQNFRARTLRALEGLQDKPLFNGDTVTLTYSLVISWTFIEFLFEEHRRKKG